MGTREIMITRFIDWLCERRERRRQEQAQADRISARASLGPW